jgi:DNA-binding SARP family transcriptional activator
VSGQPREALTFGILGPVEVRVDDRKVHLTSTKQQALLGAGLLQANAVVSVARLVDAIWGDRPPQTAVDLVQTYVYAVRRSIGRMGVGCIVTRSPGYLIRADRGALDVQVFERLTAAADRAAAGGDHERAARLLRDALARWRGPALAGLESPLFRAAAARLEEMRLLAVERRFEAESRLDASRWPVAELSAFVAEHPLRESTRGLLMRVLSRLGRRAEALQVYQQAYALFSAELGVEPGPELRRLQRAILTGDAPAEGGPRIDLGDAAPARAARSPSQLPPPPPSLVGRAAEDRVLGDALAAAPDAARSVLITIDGSAGTGKTALALTVAGRVRDAFPDGQLFVPARSTGAYPTPLADGLAMALRSFGGADLPMAPSVDERAALFRTLLAGRRVLLVLDDVWSSAEVRPFLTAHPGCAVLVTGRPALTDLDADLRLPIGPLSRQQAIELLGQTVGATRVAAQAEAARHIVAACEGLPLAVRAAAGRLVARPGWELAALADRLLDPRRCLDELSIGDLNVRDSIAGGYRRLGPPERTALERLGTAVESDVTPARIAGLLRMSETDAERLADRLVDARLLERGPGEPPRYRMPGLVRLFAQERAG